MAEVDHHFSQDMSLDAKIDQLRRDITFLRAESHACLRDGTIQLVKTFALAD